MIVRKHLLLWQNSTIFWLYESLQFMFERGYLHSPLAAQAKLITELSAFSTAKLTFSVVKHNSNYYIGK